VSGIVQRRDGPQIGSFARATGAVYAGPKLQPPGRRCPGPIAGHGPIVALTVSIDRIPFETVQVAPFACLAASAIVGPPPEGAGEAFCARVARPSATLLPQAVVSHGACARRDTLLWVIHSFKRLRKRDRHGVAFGTACFRAVPAFCDRTGTILHLVGFLYLGVSVSLTVQSHLFADGSQAARCGRPC